MKLRTKVFAGVTAVFLLTCGGIFLARNHPGMYLQNLEVAEKDETTGRINVNTATMEQLMFLPGIGKAMAGRIIEYRERFGPFRQVEDLLKVKGLGRSCLEEIQDYIMIGE